MIQLKNRRMGVNVIATILMVIAFFLVIAFSIAAISMMNLNITGRSVNVVKAHNLARAAVDEVIYHIYDITEIRTESVPLNNLTFPPLDLETYYDGIRPVLGAHPHLNDESSVDVHFKKGDSSDRYYSTDNAGNSVPQAGPFGMVPPHTIELIVNVCVGSFQRHYQVRLKKIWNFAIYSENSQLMMLSNRDKATGVIKTSSRIYGDLYSGFDPSFHPLYPPFVRCGPYMVTYNLAGKTCPASIHIGAEAYYPDDPAETTFSLTNNLLSGRACLSMKNNGLGLYVSPGNNEEAVSRISYNYRVRSIYERLKPLADGKAVPYGGGLALDVADDYTGPGLPITGSDQNRTLTAHPTDPVVTDFLETYNTEKTACETTGNWRQVFLLNGTYSLNEAASVPLEWSEQQIYKLKLSNGSALPLTDSHCTFTISPLTMTGPDSTGSMTYSYTISRDTVSYSGKLILDNAFLICDGDVTLENSSVKGTNAALQVRDTLAITSGEIQAGTGIGTAIFCTNLVVRAYGIFHGIVFAKELINVPSSAVGPPTYLVIRGSLVNKGSPANLSSNNLSEGVVSTNFSLTADPNYNGFLNAFAPIELISWRELD